LNLAADDTVVIIDCPVDYSENIRQKLKELTYLA
jgi:hypothetical protein